MAEQFFYFLAFTFFFWILYMLHYFNLCSFPLPVFVCLFKLWATISHFIPLQINLRYTSPLINCVFEHRAKRSQLHGHFHQVFSWHPKHIVGFLDLRQQLLSLVNVSTTEFMGWLLGSQDWSLRKMCWMPGKKQSCSRNHLLWVLQWERTMNSNYFFCICDTQDALRKSSCLAEHSNTCMPWINWVVNRTVLNIFTSIIWISHLPFYQYSKKR